VARLPRDSRIQTPEARLGKDCKPRKEPYWRQIQIGTFIGYAKGARTSSWIVRQRTAHGYISQRIGTPDDYAHADGDVVLSYNQAVKRATTLQAEARAPAPRHYGDGVTLDNIVTAYLEARQTTPGGRQNRVMSEDNAKTARQSWERYGQAIGKKLVTAIDAKALKTWHAQVAKTPPTKRGKVLPFDMTDPDQVRARRSTANRVLTTVKAALRWARNDERLPDSMPDFWTRVQPFALAEDSVPRMLDADEISRLLNAAAPDLRELLTGALMTGARYGDLCRFKVADFNAENGVVRIQQGKTGKLLWQPLTPEGIRFFERVTAGRASSEHVFRHADGRPWGKSEAARPMRDAVTAAKLEDVSFKATRSTYGKLLLLATKDIELVARALGHSDSRITRKHYAQYLPNEVAAGIAKLPSLGIAVDGKVMAIRQRKPAPRRS
jgi:integrase